MADISNESQIPLVSKEPENDEEQEQKDEEVNTNNNNVGTKETEKDDGLGLDETKPLMLSKSRSDDATDEPITASKFTTGIVEEDDDDDNEEKVPSKVDGNKTPKQLQNLESAIALSSDNDGSGSDNDTIKTTKNPETKNDDDNDNKTSEPLISGISGISGVGIINESKLTKEDIEISELEKEIKNIKEQLSKYKKDTPNIFNEIYENSLLNLTERQKRQRTRNREREINNQLSIREQKTLKGHFGKVYTLNWSFDSKEIVSASQDGKILIWDAISTNKRVAIPLMTAWTMTCSWSPNGEMIGSGGLDNTLSIYRIKHDTTGWESKRPFIELLDHEGYISDIEFLSDRHIISTSGDANCMLFDIEYQKLLGKFEHNGDVMSVSINRNNLNTNNDGSQLIVTGGTDGCAKVWDIRMALSGKLNDNDGNITSSTTNDSKPVYIGKSTHKFDNHTSDVNSVKWFPDGISFVTGCDDCKCRLYDLRSSRQLSSYFDKDHKSNVTDVDISKSGKYIYATYDNDPWCVVWDTVIGVKKQSIPHPSRPACLRTAPNGMCFATGCWDNKIRLWA